MSKVKIQGNASGTGVITLTAPNTSTDRTVTLPDEDITLGGGVDGIVSTADGTAITIDSAENVGIGVVPETWLSAKTALQLGGNAALYAHTEQAAGKWLEIGQNTYQQADSDIAYISTDEASAYRQHNGTHTFKVAPSGSADAAISFTTGFEVLNDGKARAKNGLLFGTDTAAANTLDDYEEGDWTPVGKFGGSAGPTGSFTGTYVKIGKQVTAAFNLPVSSLGSNTGAFTLTGLPFAPTHGNRHSTGWGYLHRIAGSTHEEMFCYLASGLIGFQEKGVNGNNSSGFTNSSFTASTHIAGSVTYETNS